MENKKNFLEDKVMLIFVLIGLLFSMLLLDNMNSTGFVVLGKEFNYIAGSFLGIALFMFIIVFLYLQVRGKNK